MPISSTIIALPDVIIMDESVGSDPSDVYRKVELAVGDVIYIEAEMVNSLALGVITGVFNLAKIVYVD